MLYDDIDFDNDRNSKNCLTQCCLDGDNNDNNNYRYSSAQQQQQQQQQQRSVQNKLLLLSVALCLLVVYIMHSGHGNLSEVHDTANNNNPLMARDDNFFDNSTVQEVMMVASVVEEAPLSSSEYNASITTDIITPKTKTIATTTSIAATTADETATQQQQQQYNNDNNDSSSHSIDTIVILGLHDIHPKFLHWAIDRIQKLYPNVMVLSDFPKADSNSNSSNSNNNSNNQHNILVLSIFINPHDWIELLRSDPYNEIYVPMDGTNHHHRQENMNWYDYVTAYMPTTSSSNNNNNNKKKTIFDLRIEAIQSISKRQSDNNVYSNNSSDGILPPSSIKSVVTVRYEDLVAPYNNNNLDDDDDDESEIEESLLSVEVEPESHAPILLPGILDLIDEIQAKTGLHPNESAGYTEPNRVKNIFWADPLGCASSPVGQGQEQSPTAHQECFPTIDTMRQDAEYVKYINEHIDWTVENTIGYQEQLVPKVTIDQIVILGERHSGAEWLMDKLPKVFPNTPIRYGLNDDRPGKYFQSDEEPHTIIEESPLLNTLVIVTFLNSYDWVELMRQRPINAPAHVDLDWSDFITSPWDRKRSNLDLALNPEDTTTANCSHGFHYDEIIPCMTNRIPTADNFPLYELHPRKALVGDPRLAGIAYDSLLELRADKIRNFLNVGSYDGVVEFIVLRYEDLMWGESYTDDEDWERLL